MSFGRDKPFRWGEEPPKWFMKEVRTAIHMMGKNKEAAHTFSVGAEGQWSFVMMMIPTVKEPELSRNLQQWYAQTFGGDAAAEWPMVNSKTHAPRSGEDS